MFMETLAFPWPKHRVGLWLAWTLTLLHLLLRGLVPCASSSGGRKGWSVGRRKMEVKGGKAAR